MTPRANLSLSEVILGALFLSLTAYNISRTPRETGWWYIAIFCLFRIVGSALLLTITLEQADTNKSLVIPATVFSGIAVSPLLAACLGFLNSCTQHLSTIYHPILRLLTLIHLLVLVALVLNAVGGVLVPLHSTPSPSPSAITSLNRAITYARASSLLFLTAWTFILLSLIILYRHWRAFAWTARVFYVAVLGGMPCLLVRILYAVLAAWDLGKGGVVTPGGGSRYGVLKGDVGVLVGMRVCMEFLVVAGWVAAGALEWWWGEVMWEEESGGVKAV
ncbi:hypothetical protein HOY82DRAFT_587105 [Tuber indicum]|nr:hypothetical protein HOY82DRAFT_587105 [Tuber indicum]